MLATLVREPFHQPGWVYEEKYDGYCILAYKEGSRVRLSSRNAIDRTDRFSDVAAAMSTLRPSTLLLDGEISVFDRHNIAHVGKSGKSTNYVLGGALATQLALANLGCIAVHVSGSRASFLRKPDWVCFDLDPQSGKFSDAARAGLYLKESTKTPRGDGLLLIATNACIAGSHGAVSKTWIASLALAFPLPDTAT